MPVIATEEATPSHDNIRFQEFADHPPIRLQFIVDATDACQLRCSYCYKGAKGKRLMDVPKVLSAIINTANVFGNKLAKVGVHFMGGEPTLAWSRIRRLNESTRSYFELRGVSYAWSLTSNLVSFDKQKVEYMLRERANIHCSLDGPARIQDKNRPRIDGSGSFARVASNASLALSVTPDDAARATICPEDAGSLHEIANTAFELGFQSVGLHPAYNMGWTRESIMSWGEGLRAAITHVRSRWGTSRRVSTIVRSREMLQGDKFHYCGAGRGLWAIDTQGNLFHCHHLTGRSEYLVIDAANASPQEIRRAIETSNVPPTTFAVPAECSTCPVNSRCNGGCWASNLLTNGSPVLPNSVECTMKRVTLEVLTDLSEFGAAPGACDECSHCDCRSDSDSETHTCGCYCDCCDISPGE